MTNEELFAHVAGRIIDNVASNGGPPYVNTFDDGSRVGFSASMSPSANSGRELSTDAAWMGIFGDRGDSRGPASFPPADLEEAIRSASLVVIDVAQPETGVYDVFTHCVNQGAKILVIQTVESRRAVWRQFVRPRLRQSHIVELTPMNEPKGAIQLAIIDLEHPDPN